MAVIATLVVAISAMARDFAYNGLIYTVIDENAKTCQTKDGSNNSYGRNPGNTVSGDFVIPSTALDNEGVAYTVVGIGYAAFVSSNNLTSITIPSSVTQIGEYAFEKCTGLKNVYTNSIEPWCKIKFGNSESNPLKYADNLYVNGELIQELVIPNSVTTINSYAFAGCSSLSSVSIPKTVVAIGSGAFIICN